MQMQCHFCAAIEGVKSRSGTMACGLCVSLYAGEIVEAAQAVAQREERRLWMMLESDDGVFFMPARKRRVNRTRRDTQRIMAHHDARFPEFQRTADAPFNAKWSVTVRSERRANFYRYRYAQRKARVNMLTRQCKALGYTFQRTRDLRRAIRALERASKRLCE